jgi:hypothetical protein
MTDGENSHPHPATYIRTLFQREVVSRDAALAFATALLQDHYGAEEFAAQQPLAVQSVGDTWVIEGARRPKHDPTEPPGSLMPGRAHVVISKPDGRILKLVCDGHLPTKF